MTPETGFRKCNTGPCILFRVDEIRTEIVIVYIDETFAIGNKPELMDRIELILRNIIKFNQ